LCGFSVYDTTIGGFAQVYLVRTQTPVYNTTHHVLKHIVVADESMLTEVKNEVDVMVDILSLLLWGLFTLFHRDYSEDIQTLSI